MLSGIKNILFDLGGVVIDIDFKYTIEALAQLSGKTVEEVHQLSLQDAYYDKYERGHLTNAQFLDLIRKSLAFEAEDEEVIAAWNALLLAIPKERIDLVKKLSENYKVLVLSNTSNYHVLGFNEILKNSTGHASLNEVYHHVYFSYDLGCRKPEARIYEKVLENAGIKAEETLFLDDNYDNIQAAEKLGFKTIHVTDKDILEIFSNEIQ